MCVTVSDANEMQLTVPRLKLTLSVWNFTGASSHTGLGQAERVPLLACKGNTREKEITKTERGGEKEKDDQERERGGWFIV